METVPARPRQRVGGRSARVHRAVIEATLVELAESGYGGLSVEAVARRAGVHKTTVYRHWPDRERLVTDALMQRSVEEFAVPDTGALRSDLVTLAMAIVAQLTQPHVTALIRVLVAEGPWLPAFRHIARSFWAARFERTGVVVRRAIHRGELPPETDVPTVLESLIAPLYLRLLVTGGELSDEFVAGGGGPAPPRRPPHGTARALVRGTAWLTAALGVEGEGVCLDQTGRVGTIDPEAFTRRVNARGFDASLTGASRSE